MNKSELLVQSITETLQSVLPAGEPLYPLHEPYFGGRESEFTTECIETGWVSSVGSFVDKFEEVLSEYTGVKHAVVTVNGTAALQICLILADVKAGDEVIIPALTFVATANAVSYLSAIPHMVDSDPLTLGLDPEKLGDYLGEIAQIKEGECYNKFSGRRIKAVVPMHCFGHAVDLEPLVELCSRWNLTLVEDAAESLGSYYKGTHTGNFGLCSALSFNGNKIITCGGGGAILTNDPKLGKLAKHITTTAKAGPQKDKDITIKPWDYYHDTIGYNYRMPNLNAALGVAQMEQLPDFILKKKKLAQRYQEAFESVSGVKFFTEPEFSNSNYWLNCLILVPEFADKRDELLEVLNKDHKIQARPVWTLMNKLPMFKDCPKMDLSIATSLEQRIINIPSGIKICG